MNAASHTQSHIITRNRSQTHSAQSQNITVRNPVGTVQPVYGDSALLITSGVAFVDDITPVVHLFVRCATRRCT